MTQQEIGNIACFHSGYYGFLHSSLNYITYQLVDGKGEILPHYY